MNGVVFLWPQMLWALTVLPLVLLAYWWLLHRRKRQALRYSSLGVLKAALGPGRNWRRHVPPALLGLALLGLILALARPAATITLPLHDQTLILAIDVSGSMQASDIPPSRLAAAQEAAKDFVRGLPRSVRVGIVSFAGSAAVVQAPTTSRDDVNAAIDRFQLQRGTAVGSGIVLSLATLFPDAGIDLRDVTGERRARVLGQRQVAAEPFVPVPPGSYDSAAIILLTDGQTTTGPDPRDAAELAAERGVKVYTVGFGTTDGEVTEFEGWSMRVRLDETTLQHIAASTQAEYFHAGSAQDLGRVYETLSSRLVLEHRETEVTALLSGASALLLVLGAGLSLAWFGRVV